ncbi:PREDICTED: transcription factor bHLH128 [Tarenaya hassleriana]|uniref:transcription factor bHLH128 n=1 Tax=Tarenaya hassleriana TaxID=28532 RepID=UPI00053C404A|nr:PREDICTED: transcription factor bHLH128 [Tarenaya hassleriana]
MYQSSPSTSSSQKSSLPGGGLIRYGSAPGSLLNSAVDAVIGQPENFLGHFFSGDSSSLRSESTCGVSSSDGRKDLGKDLLDRSYGLEEISQHRSSDNANSGPYSLARQRSSPADFFSYLTSDKNGFSVSQLSQGTGEYSGGGRTRLKTQLSFTGHHDSLGRISEVNESAIDDTSDHSFATDSWDDASGGSIGFTMTRPAKRPRDTDPSPFSQFSISDTSHSYMENFMQLPEDSVPCKIRAKRGCATHPRSIAERERRTRISGKLKKLQELVPNMDKQTSYADMLDLAVEHIKGLQQQLDKLQKEQGDCTCGCGERPDEGCGL